MNPSAAALLLGIVIAGPASAQDKAPGIRLSTSSFIFARWASRSSSSMYSGYTFGPAGVFFGVVSNPRTGYRELLGGAVTRVTWSDQAVTLGLAYADASDGRYLQTYLVPSLNLGGAGFSGTLELYAPVDSSGTWQLDVNPLVLVVRPVPWIGIGAAYAVGMGEGSRPRHRAGPAVELGIPRGALKAELLRNMTLTYTEFRMSLQAAF